MKWLSVIFILLILVSSISAYRFEQRIELTNVEHASSTQVWTPTSAGTTIGTVDLDLSKYDGIKEIYFEITGQFDFNGIPNGVGCSYSRLYDITNSSAVTGSQFNIGASDSVYRSGNISYFWSNPKIKVMMQGYACTNCDYNIYSARVVIVQDGATKTRTYIPLGGSRTPPLRGLGILMVTFLVSGLWHGASWTFVIWGAIHGLAMALYRVTRRPRVFIATRLEAVGLKRLWSLVAVSATLAVVGFSWIFFRADSLGDAIYVTGHMFRDIPRSPGEVVAQLSRLGLSRYDFSLSLIAIVILLAVDLAQERWGSLRRLLSGAPAALRIAVYQAAVLSILLFGYSSVRPEFIYFQF